MDVRIRRSGFRTGAVRGSVWETRMKLDEVKGGSGVCNGDDNSEESLVKLRRRSMGRGVVSGKMKTWKAESFDGNDKILIQKGEGKSNLEKNCGNQCKELSVSGDGLKRSPVQMRKLKSEGTNVAVNAAVDKFDRRPSQTRKKTPEVLKGTGELGKEVGESGEAIDKSPVQLKKAKSDSVKIQDDAVEFDIGDSDRKLEQNSSLSRKSKSESAGVLEEPEKGTDDGIVGEVDKIPIDNEKTESDETCKEFGVCEEKVIPNSADDVVVTKNTSPNLVETAGDVASEEFDEGDDEEKDIDEEIETEIKQDDFDIKEINTSETKNVVSEVRKFNQVSEKPRCFSLTVTKPTPVRVHSPIHQSFSKINSKQHQSFPPTHGKLQTLVDLIMWRDVSRSTFVFMIGSFTIVSSSYVKDVNVSIISAMSYVGLVYLTAIFLYRSLVCRGVIDVDDSTKYVLGQEEATWVLTLLLPYLNELLIKLRALFSGDPATTMKLAVLLFALARCGSSITIWKMVKYGFFGVFTVPKVCSLYSSQIIAYANFWIHRFQDAWNSCTQKKAVGIGIFILVWNLSSVVARIWAAFMLYVGFRYYQQNLARHNWVGLEVEDDAANVPVVHDHEETAVLQKPIGRQRQWRGPTVNHQRSKVKKGIDHCIRQPS